MSCRAIVALVAVSAACTPIDAPLVVMSGRATAQVVLASPIPAPVGGTLQWTVIERPQRSAADAPPNGANTTFVPDVRGTYVVGVWIVDGVSDDLVQRYEIDVAGMPPMPIIAGVGSAGSVGSTIAADASQSSSPEGLALTFAWRLATRPFLSTTMLSDASGSTTSFVADVAGTFVIELSAYDGELWSDAPASAMLQAGP